MARKPRIVVAGKPLHIIQRGNDRQAVFYADEDYQRYLDDLNTASQQHGCEIHAYVLMTGHVLLLESQPEITARLAKNSCAS